MAEERRYGGEPRPLPPVNEQAAADLQQRINDRRAGFDSYRQQNDAMMRDIGDAWRAGGPTQAGDAFERARLDREAARGPGPVHGAPPPGQSIQVGRAPAIDEAYVRNFAQQSADLRYRQAAGALSREIMAASPDEAMRRLSGLTHEQYAGLNPAVDGRHPGDTQPIAAPGGAEASEQGKGARGAFQKLWRKAAGDRSARRPGGRGA